MVPEPDDEPRGSVAIYVPRPGSSLREKIAEGSGVVGPAASGDARIRVDFEGNLHGLPELARYADRVERAAQRHQWKGGDAQAGYSTSARARIDRTELIRIGRFDPLTRRLDIADRSTLAEWLKVEAVPDRELKPSKR